jgi:flagellar biosynthesis/type III secretory pathway protein FliH
MTWSSKGPAASGEQAPAQPFDRWDLEELSSPEATAPGGDQQERESLRQQEIESAYRRGRAEGEEAAHARARREVASALSAARRIVQEVRDAQASWERTAQDNLVALATAIARHVVGRELMSDPYGYRDLVKRALETFPDDQTLKVRLNPADLAMLAAAADAPLPDTRDLGREVRWVADEQIAPGGCVVEGPERIVDGRVDEALERLYRKLTRG